MFTSDGHQYRYKEANEKTGKLVDRGYASALYILTSSQSTWERTEAFVDDEGIHFREILGEIDWSAAYRVLIELAANLFNSGDFKANPGDLQRLDERNFKVAITAIQISYYGMATPRVMNEFPR